MSTDYIFRNAAIGGFNKDDVIKYITNIKQNEAVFAIEKADLLKEIEALKAENAELKETVSAHEQTGQTLKDTISNSEKEIDALKAENERLNEEIAEIKKDFESQLSDKESSSSQELRALRAEYEKQAQTIAASTDRTVQEVVGTAMLDVRRYADLLLKETCEKINTMSCDADTAVAKTLTKVLDISTLINSFSEQFKDIVADITAENDKICGELTSFKGSLKIPFEDAVKKLDDDILTIKD